jgi:heme A synthase
MKMLYELPATMGDPVAWLQWINLITGYWFGPGVIMAFFVIMFLAFKRYSTETAFATSSVISAVLCFLFMLLGLCSVPHLVLASLAALSSLFFLKSSRGGQ